MRRRGLCGDLPTFNAPVHGLRISAEPPLPPHRLSRSRRSVLFLPSGPQAARNYVSSEISRLVFRTIAVCSGQSMRNPTDTGGRECCSRTRTSLGGDALVSIDAGRRVKRWRSPSRHTGLVSAAGLSSFPYSPNNLRGPSRQLACTNVNRKR